ncbi:MAG: uroporphyrinogen decarboxylase family protein [Chloroflexi bacterium]|nr:uroporphyrinogen decarboxylase family protein [Chloroflexota bacterium]
MARPGEAGGGGRDVFRLEVPPPTAGLWGRRIEYLRVWQELIADYEVTFNGEPGRVMIRPLEAGGEGPFLTAVDLVGQDFYLWLRECPDVCHVLLDKITTALLHASLHFRAVDPRPRPLFVLADDFAELISADMFRQFCIPYDHRLFAILGGGLQSGRALHMCGDTTHLLDVLVNEERITDFVGYGAMVDAKLIADKMGGRVRVTGGILPYLLLRGPQKEIYEAAMDCLRAFARHGGFTLADGFNVAPGTPFEHLATVVQAAVDYGPLPRPGAGGS